jgi:hypothetical protein
MAERWGEGKGVGAVQCVVERILKESFGKMCEAAKQVEGVS